MLTMDIFRDDAFRVSELTEAVNNIPNQWGRIGELGLFGPRSIRTTTFEVESKNGVIQLVQSSQRGTAMPGARRGKREMRTFRTPRFGLSDTVIADDIQGIRPFGQTSALAQVIDIVIDRQSEMRGSMDITREYLRAGALQGQVRDADGTVLVDLFDEFGITQKEVDFVLGTASTDIIGKAAEVKRHVELNLRGDVMRGVHALCSPTFWDKLMAHDDFREAHRYYQSVAEPLRNDVRGGFRWQGITWEEYLAEGEVPQEDGSIVTSSFIPDGEARFFPVGTRQTFRQYNAPADYMETVNTPGLDFYSKVMPDPKANRFVEIEVQMNSIPFCVRPGVLVRGHSSN
ncbi:major capsid protein [Limimaricola pyoseonensis]|uniref:Phage major capsid protein E n=1 Tax=Limimaricola pyoseonensis TaxID=521013 RepID=A0A1G7GQD5_9RHOB|nr:major capsid protein [Limimaricola pyoseonensis]SDE90301.1 Phage major capsid protein E [Limimaricola pyoseonensis]